MLTRTLNRKFSSKVFTFGWNYNNLGNSSTGKEFSLEKSPMKLNLNEAKKIQKIVMGYSESLVLNQDGSLYSFGTQHVLKDNNLDVTLNSELQNNVADADVDYSHAIYLTKDGRVMEQDKNGLKEAAINANVHSVACGNGFSLAVVGNEYGSQKVIVWATNKDCHPSVFCREEVPTSPVEIKSLSQLIQTDNTRIKKLKVVGNSIAVLLENGVLAVWGNNRTGNLAIPRSLTIMHNVYVNDVKVPFVANKIKDFVKDFDMSSNNIIILSEKGDLYYSGRDKDLKLEKLQFFNNKKVASVGSFHNNYVIVTEQGEVFATEQPHEEILSKYWGDFKLYQYDPEYFHNEKVVTVSGKYDNAYAMTA